MASPYEVLGRLGWVAGEDGWEEALKLAKDLLDPANGYDENTAVSILAANGVFGSQNTTIGDPSKLTPGQRLQASDPNAPTKNKLNMAGAPAGGISSGARLVPLPGSTGLYVWVGEDGKYITNPATGEPLTVDAKDVTGGGGSAEWGRLAVDQERLGFDREKYAQDFTEGTRRWEAEQGIALRKLGIDEETLKARRDEFATNFAENQRQFNVTEGRASLEFGERQALERSRLNQEGDYQRGQLQLGQSRLDLERQAQAQENAIRAQQNALAKQQYIGKVLSSPSDFIARAFMQRGMVSPNTPITQADLINQIETEYAKNPVTYVAPQNTPGAPTPKYAEGTPPAPSANASSPPVDPETKRLQTRTDSIAKLLQYIENPDTQHKLVDELAEARGRLSGAANEGGGTGGQFGMVNDTKAIVGDPQVPGVPNPEMVINPTGAPMAVVPMNRLQGAEIPQYAGGTPYTNPLLPSSYASQGYGNYDSTSGKPLAGQKTVGNWWDSPYMDRGTAPGTRGTISGSGVLSDYVTPTDSQRSLMDAWNRGQFHDSTTQGMNFAQWIQAGMPRANTVQGPQPLTPAQLAAQEQARLAARTQEEIIADAEATLPPAIRALFGNQVGQKPRLTTGGTENPISSTGVPSLRFGFNLFSPQSLAQLTSAEQEALGSYLGVKYNTTLEDVGTALQQTFGKQQGRSGRLRI